MRLDNLIKLLFFAVVALPMMGVSGETLAGSKENVRDIAKNAETTISGAVKAISKFQRSNGMIEKKVAVDQADLARIREARMLLAEMNTSAAELYGGEGRIKFRERLGVAIDKQIAYYRDWRTAEDLRKEILAGLGKRSKISGDLNKVQEKIAILKKKPSLLSYAKYFADVVAALKKADEKAEETEK